jgi:hypothetical protein
MRSCAARPKEVDRAGQHEWIYGPPRGQSRPANGPKEFLKRKKRHAIYARRVFLLTGDAFHGYSSKGTLVGAGFVTDPICLSKASVSLNGESLPFVVIFSPA